MTEQQEVAPLGGTCAQRQVAEGDNYPAVEQWRALWDLEDGLPAWLRDSVSAMDAAIQGQMGHI